MFANCKCKTPDAANIRVQSDWLAFRPANLTLDNFSAWSTEANAETYMTDYGVRGILDSGQFEVIQPINNGGHPGHCTGACRIVTPQWWHFHGSCKTPCIQVGNCSFDEVLDLDAAAERLRGTHYSSSP